MERYDGMPHRILDLPAEAIDWDEIRRATRETP